MSILANDPQLRKSYNAGKGGIKLGLLLRIFEEPIQVNEMNWQFQTPLALRTIYEILQSFNGFHLVQIS